MSSYQVAVLVLQVCVGLGTSIALLHFAALVVTRAVKGEPNRRQPDQPLHYAFMIPCLNEELVIGETVRRLLAMRSDVAVYVIDDGSTDETAAIVRDLAGQDERVRLLQRVLPNARQGKGRALNTGFRRVVRDYEERGIDPATVIVGIMDADGLLDANAIDAVDGLFGFPDVGAAQICVRIANRRTFSGRLQDIEFFVFACIVQQGRNHLGSVGLGGNGQFTRLSAVIGLGDDPWSDCLTEDLDLGLRLLTNGWRLSFTNEAAVHQQGLESLKKLLRQRARWVQGHFQCWKHIPNVMRMRAKWYTVVDLLYYLTWPVVSCLILPIALVASWVVVGFAISSMDIVWWQWASGIFVAYLLAFATNAAIGLHYRAKSRDISLGRVVVLVHLFGLYQFVWAAAGWWSVARIVFRRRGWSKTERLALPSEPGATAG